MTTNRRFSQDTGTPKQPDRHFACQFRPDKPWLNLKQHDNGTIMKPDELKQCMNNPPDGIDHDILDRIHGSMIGMALGDALGAHVEFRPHAYMVANPVTNLEGGGTWGLKKGQFTDDTSMALCLANSLVARRNYVPYDQLVRYKWWYRKGYMSSTGKCFDIGAATRNSLEEFECRQTDFAKKYDIPVEQLDFLSDSELLKEFDVNCSEEGVAGNGALMRLAPVPLFFYLHPVAAVKYSGLSGKITHGDEKAYDACRYYGALVVAAVNGAKKTALIDKNFYKNHQQWFGDKSLHPDIMNIAMGSYQKKEGYAKGIRGKGYIVSALEAALWAFWSDDGSFKKGVLAAVNLGDDTDTTAAIYGQLAGACYGYKKLPVEWVDQIYAKDFIECVSKWIAYEGSKWNLEEPSTPDILPVTVESSSNVDNASFFEHNTNLNEQSTPEENREQGSKLLTKEPNAHFDAFSKFGQSTYPTGNHRGRRQSIVDPTFNSRPGSNQQTIGIRRKSMEYPQRIYSSEDLISCKDVLKWLKTLGKDYAPYVKAFEGRSIDGSCLLNYTDDENLKNYGVEREDHRQTILANITQLKKGCSVKVVSEEE